MTQALPTVKYPHDHLTPCTARADTCWTTRTQIFYLVPQIDEQYPDGWNIVV